MGGVVEPNSSSPTHKRAKKPASGSLARVPARAKHAARGISDETVAAAVIAAGGRTGKAAKVLGVTSSDIRKRIAGKPSLHGLTERAKQEFRALLKRNVRKFLEEGNERVTIEMMKTKFGRDLGFAPDVQKVELSGKVDGDLRLGVLDERAAAARLKALEEAK